MWAINEVGERMLMIHIFPFVKFILEQKREGRNHQPPFIQGKNAILEFQIQASNVIH